MRVFKSDESLPPIMGAGVLIDRLNEALGWELRAMSMYAHYAANVQGIHRLQLDPMFNEEATESMAHADVYRGDRGASARRAHKIHKPAMGQSACS